MFRLKGCDHGVVMIFVRLILKLNDSLGIHDYMDNLLSPQFSCTYSHCGIVSRLSAILSRGEECSDGGLMLRGDEAVLVTV